MSPPCRLAWSTDVHLNFLSKDEVFAYCQKVSDVEATSLTLSGDIAEGPTLKYYLTLMEQELGRNIYFVLGNHDYYRSSIRRVRKMVTELCRESEHLFWLNDAGVVELAPSVGLIGHDGWSDGRFGDYHGSGVVLNDYMLIEELSDMSAGKRLTQLNLLGDEAAAHMRVHLPEALEQYSKVFVVTHVPPFREACWKEGMLSNDEWLPHFACKAMGEAIADIVEQYPRCEVTVLCGHTHSRGFARIRPNLVVRTGGAVYGSPVIEEVIVVDPDLASASVQK